MTAPQRIVSLLPGSTEILCALDLTERLVGVSHACDYPPALASCPRLTAPQGTRVDAQHALQGLSSYPLDLALLRAVQPDLIIAEATAETPGPVSAALLEATRRVVGRPVEVLSLHPTLLQDIWDDIHHLGAVTGQHAQAASLLVELFARVNAIIAETIMLRTTPRVALLAGIEPLMPAGYWTPDLLQLAGGQADLCPPGCAPTPLSWHTVCDYAPDVLIVSPCGYTLPQTLAEIPRLQQLPGWHSLPAVQQGQVYAVEGQTALYRPGPRIVESLELLAGLLHPALFEELLPSAEQIYCPVLS